jgi:hypothetical protein
MAAAATATGCCFCGVGELTGTGLAIRWALDAAAGAAAAFAALELAFAGLCFSFGY